MGSTWRSSLFIASFHLDHYSSGRSTEANCRELWQWVWLLEIKKGWHNSRELILNLADLMFSYKHSFQRQVSVWVVSLCWWRKLGHKTQGSQPLRWREHDRTVGSLSLPPQKLLICIYSFITWANVDYLIGNLVSFVKV